jgi:hypothetical protein
MFAFPQAEDAGTQTYQHVEARRLWHRDDCARSHALQLHPQILLEFLE